MTIYTHSVYWIHLPEHKNIFTQGYIGVSNDPIRRMLEHRNTFKLKNDKNPLFSRMLNKYSGIIIQTIIFTGTEEACYIFEENLRPKKNIGWNVNKGGNKPPSKLGWKPSKSTLEKRSKSLSGIKRNESWCKNLSDAKIGAKNGMFGVKKPCSFERKIAIIKTKNKNKLPKLIKLFELLHKNESIRNISQSTGFSTGFISAIKKNPNLHFEAFPILKQFETS